METRFSEDSQGLVQVPDPVLVPFELDLSAERPRLLLEMRDVCVPLGEAVQFECSFSGFSAVEWDHNGSSLDQDSDRVRTWRTGPSLGLVITAVNEEDQGVYRCTAANVNGHSSASARLTLKGQCVLFLSPPSSSTSLQLHRSASGPSPHPTTPVTCLCPCLHCLLPFLFPFLS